jgi:hypothetical protein
MGTHHSGCSIFHLLYAIAFRYVSCTVSHTVWRTRDKEILTTLLFLPDFPASDPCGEHITTVIKNDQVCVCAGAECALPVFNAETPRRIGRHAFNRFTQRTPREAREVADAGVQGDDTKEAYGLARIVPERR